MTRFGRMTTKLLAVLALTLVLIGIGSQTVGATIVDAGRPNSPASEKSACLKTGGTWTTEHNGSVGICTYPNGNQTRCSWRTGRCTTTVPFAVQDGVGAPAPSVPVNPGTVYVGAASNVKPATDPATTPTNTAASQSSVDQP